MFFPLRPAFRLSDELARRCRLGRRWGGAPWVRSHLPFGFTAMRQARLMRLWLGLGAHNGSEYK